MATRPIAADHGNVTYPARFPPATAARLAGKLLHRHSAHEIAEAVEVLLDVLNLLDGDPDAEECDLEDSFTLSAHALREAGRGAGCPIADCHDETYVEWHAKPANLRRAGQGEYTAGPDDAEDDDPAGQTDEDEFNTGFDALSADDGPGCMIGDPDACPAGDDRIASGASPGFVDEGGPGDADDGEHWGHTDNVPMPPVMSLEYNLFTDCRVSLGLANLQDSYRSNGDGVLSADTGAHFRSRATCQPIPPGKPI